MVNQKSREVFYYKIPVFISDLVIHLAALAVLLKVLPAEHLAGVENSWWSLAALLAVSFSASIGFIGLRLHERRIKPAIVLWRAVRQTFMTYVVFTVLVVMVYKAVPRHLILLLLLFTTFIIALWHYIVNRLVRCFRRFGHNTRQVVMVGADETAKRVYRELMNGQVTTGYNVLGFFTSIENFELPEGADYLGGVEDSFDWLQTHHPDEIYCSLPPSTCPNEVNRLIQLCNDRFIDFYFVPTMDGYPHRKMAIHDFGSVMVLKLRDEPLNNPMSKMFKRLFDIFASLVFLCTLYPFVFLFVWLGDILTGSKGPVYFRQARTGYNGKSFLIYKFRSMKVNADADTVQATKDDPRKTKFGNFLRKSSIDELPQFINVLKGDMSIVGPRPHMEHHTEIYSGLINDYMVRHLAKPGITGWAQVNGCRGETETVDKMANRVKHDIWYIEHWTPLLDLEILLKTCWQVLPGHDKQAY